MYLSYNINTDSNRNVGKSVATPEYRSKYAGLRYCSLDWPPFREKRLTVDRKNRLYKILGGVNMESSLYGSTYTLLTVKSSTEAFNNFFDYCQ